MDPILIDIDEDEVEYFEAEEYFDYRFENANTQCRCHIRVAHGYYMHAIVYWGVEVYAWIGSWFLVRREEQELRLGVWNVVCNETQDLESASHAVRMQLGSNMQTIL